MGKVADAGATARIDNVVMDDIRKGWAVLPVEEATQAALRAEGIPAPQYIRFLKMNPSRKRLVSELVHRRYAIDMKDDTLLSEAQMRVLALKRGDWTPADDEKLAALTESSNALMQKLYAAGYASNGANAWSSSLADQAGTVREALADDAQALARFERWLDFSPRRQDEYTALYAKGQKRDKYSPDLDYQLITQHSAAVADLVDQIDELKTHLETYIEMLKVRGEQVDLQVRRDKLFEQTTEARRDQTEEMARLYITATACNASGELLGPLAPTFDELWNFPFDVLQYLTSESYLFHNNIPTAAREFLELFGFLAPKPSSGVSTPSDGSPDEPTPSSDSPAAAETPAASSEATTPTT